MEPTRPMSGRNTNRAASSPRPRSNVVRFPHPRTIEWATRAAIRNLARARLVTEREAVRMLEDLGAPEEEIDLVRGICAVVRRKL